MSSRNRFEGRWTDADAKVKGRWTNRWWVLPLCLVLVLVPATLLYRNYQGSTTATFEIYQCVQPLSAETTWEEIEGAGCEPADAADYEVRRRIAEARSEPDEVHEHSYVFKDYPSNSPGNAVELTAPVALESVVVVELEEQLVRRALSSDSRRQDWYGHLGGRGGHEYRLLVTPTP